MKVFQLLFSLVRHVIVWGVLLVAIACPITCIYLSFFAEIDINDYGQISHYSNDSTKIYIAKAMSDNKISKFEFWQIQDMYMTNKLEEIKTRLK